MLFKKLDHIAIAVSDTEDALQFYRDKLGLSVLVSEVLDGPGVRLTHLDMGNVELQLVEPLSDDHPIAKFISERGEGLHHLCWQTQEEIQDAMRHVEKSGLSVRPNEPHDAPNAGKAAFIEPADTRGVLWEFTCKHKS
jgi:methylmalonyl-CoA epimerase